MKEDCQKSSVVTTRKQNTEIFNFEGEVEKNISQLRVRSATFFLLDYHNLPPGLLDFRFPLE